MTRATIRKSLLVITPAFLAIVFIGLVWLTDNTGTFLVARIRLETLILFTGIAVSTCLITLLLVRQRIHSNSIHLRAQQQQESRLEHQRFIRRLDHELKNPLTAVHLGLENLSLVVAGKDAKRSISEIKAQAQRLNQLTNDLRKLAAFDDQELILEEINIADLLNDTKALIDDLELAEQRNIQVILPAAPWPVPNIYGDCDLLQLALYNLIENAIKYSNTNDHVDIRAFDVENWVKIEVADTGLGIKKQDLDTVCEELFRGQNGRERSGTGIGLSLVKRIIERHEGQLDISSKENTGTRITITLPIHSK